MIDDLRMPSAFKALHRKQLHETAPLAVRSTTPQDASAGTYECEVASENPSLFAAVSRSGSSLTVATDVSIPTHSNTSAQGEARPAKSAQAARDAALAPVPSVAPAAAPGSPGSPGTALAAADSSDEELPPSVASVRTTPLPPPRSSPRFNASYPLITLGNALTPMSTLAISSVASFGSGVDQYGFKKPVADMPVEAFDAWSRDYAAYMRKRQAKWAVLLRAHGLACPATGAPVRFPPDSHRVRKYVRKGIPPAWRGAAWFYYARGHDKLSAHPGLYARLVQESQGLCNSDTEHIERDLHRTFPDNVYFRNNANGEESAHLQALRRVLTVFSVYRPRIGYCQSLNFIAGNLLLFLDEEKAFWMLVIITQQHLSGLHEVNLEQVNISQGVLMLSVRDRMPRVWQALNRDAQLEENFISSLPPVSLCTAPWFMSLMVNVLPTETMLRVWDCFFLEGAKTLYRIALAVFKIMEPRLLKATDELEVFQIIQSSPGQLYDPEVLMKTCYKRQNGFGHVSNEDIALLRAFVDERRKRARADVAGETSDRREYARLHRGRRIRARLKLYR